MKHPLVVLTLFLLPACAEFQPLQVSPNGSRVRIATAITVSEAEAYQELGTPTCTTEYRSQRECEIVLRNQAGALGADVLVIESRSSVPCGFENKHTCQETYARAYRKKAS